MLVLYAPNMLVAESSMAAVEMKLRHEEKPVKEKCLSKKRKMKMKSSERL